MNDPSVTYRLNRRDEIVYVDEAWREFAEANAAYELAPVNVLHRSLWDFVVDETTRTLYRDMLHQVRSGRELRFGFRCDAPEWRRRLEMMIRPCAENLVEFRTRAIQIERRPFEPLLARTTPRTAELLTSCSWCKRVAVDNLWVEVEEAIERMQLFDASALPLVTHGICEDCFVRFTDQLRAGSA